MSGGEDVVLPSASTSVRSHPLAPTLSAQLTRRVAGATTAQSVQNIVVAASSSVESMDERTEVRWECWGTVKWPSLLHMLPMHS